MIIKSAQLNHYRAFVDSGKIEFDQINVLIGPNNSGKSSVLRALHLLQKGLPESYGDVRPGAGAATVDIHLQDADVRRFVYGGKHPPPTEFTFRAVIRSKDRITGTPEYSLMTNGNISSSGISQIENVGPDHAIIPIFSPRNTGNFGEDTRDLNAKRVNATSDYLAAKLAVIGNPSHPNHEAYATACTEILGFVVSNITSPNGSIPGTYFDQSAETISIKQMGQGVVDIVILLAHLATEKDKLFLIEEPENNIHPKGLKALLDLIKISSEKNQFVISTHSNIVVTHLCSEKNSKLFEITSDTKKPPAEAKIKEVEPSATERIRVLQELGYTFSDFELADGWLFLEEASAERIIKDFLIPLFAPGLKTIRTVSTKGTGNVKPLFNDFNNLILFSNLQEVYRNKTWVLLDGDESGKSKVEVMRQKFGKFPREAFDIFPKAQFERYLPIEFKAKIDEVFEIEDKEESRRKKKELLDEVLKWLNEDHERAKNSLEKSAAEVIDKLKEIESKLKGTSQPNNR